MPRLQRHGGEVMSDNKCPHCGQWQPRPNSHSHYRKFLAIDPDYTGDDWYDAYPVCAFDHEDAARDAANEMDSSQGEGANEREIHVRPVDDPSDMRRFNITFDYSVDYFASEVK